MYDKPGQPRKVIMVKGIEITAKHPIYGLRYGMMTRCYNAKSKPSDFKHYQSKGIQVCDQWRNNPQSFYEWCLSNGWEKGLVIDRIDPDKNYEPSNCRFLTAAQNNLRIPVRRGLKHPGCKTSIPQVMRIKQLVKLGILAEDIAKICNTTKYIVSDISKGKTWRHIKVEFL